MFHPDLDASAVADTVAVDITSDTEDRGTAATATDPVAGGSHNGTVQVYVDYATTTEIWTLVCTETTMDTRFSVTGSVSGQHRDALVGQNYSADRGEVRFLITGGTTSFVVGDSFTFSTTAATVVSEAVTLTETGINTGVWRTVIWM